MANGRKIKVLLAKTGLDGHDRGIKVLTMGLRDEGMEVIYTGIRQTPEKVAQTAVQERVDVVGLSSLSAAHRHLFPRVVELLRERGGGDTLVIAGGIIPEEDVSFLKEKGIKAVFGPGTSVKAIADFIREHVKQPETEASKRN
ncbi:MAG: cobalamin B12-binding domain-containing protein [Dehalococcoidales bacterium]|nr:cobalamin B12-binding domain-containing protein [Dehalococcoidales bacterium]